MGYFFSNLNYSKCTKNKLFGKLIFAKLKIKFQISKAFFNFKMLIISNFKYIIKRVQSANTAICRGFFTNFLSPITFAEMLRPKNKINYCFVNTVNDFEICQFI
jgi:hypothetical protein